MNWWCNSLLAKFARLYFGFGEKSIDDVNLRWLNLRDYKYNQGSETHAFRLHAQRWLVLMESWNLLRLHMVFDKEIYLWMILYIPESI